jgi:hypothetical protein
VDNPSSDGHLPGDIYRVPSATQSVPARNSGLLIHALAGLEAGMVGVIWMFGCFVVAAFWIGRGIWSVPNLFSTVFYGDFAYQDEFLRTTWSGIALVTVIYGLIGAAWGCFWKEDRKPLLAFFGAVTGMAVYYLFFDLIWQHANPLIPLYAPVRELQVAHILWGAALARSPGYARQIAAASLPSAVPPPMSFPAGNPHAGNPHAGDPHAGQQPGIDQTGGNQTEARQRDGDEDAKTVSGELIL